MQSLGNNHRSWAALLSVALAFVFLWCHTPTAEAHAGAGLASVRASLAGLELVAAGTHAPAAGGAWDCAAVTTAPGTPDSPPAPRTLSAGSSILPATPVALLPPAAWTDGVPARSARPHAGLVAQAVLIRI